MMDSAVFIKEIDNHEKYTPPHNVLYYLHYDYL
jgi:hypothetical protein